MQDFYDFMNNNNYFWGRHNTKEIWVALNGYKVFDERYEVLMTAARAAKAIHIESKFDQQCGKTFYIFKHK